MSALVMTTSHVTLLLIGLTCLILSGCSKKTYIKTDPVDALATLDDGRTLGKTPILLEEDVWAWTKHKVTFTKTGYKPKTITMNAKASVANIALCGIGACVLWMAWPVCMVGKYPRSDYRVKLKKNPDFDNVFGQEGTGSSSSHDTSGGSSISFEPRPR